MQITFIKTSSDHCLRTHELLINSTVLLTFFIIIGSVRNHQFLIKHRSSCFVGGLPGFFPDNLSMAEDPLRVLFGYPFTSSTDR